MCWGLNTQWLVAIAVIFGLFMAVLDATVVNIALPKLQSVFGATLDDIQWVVTSRYTGADGERAAVWLPPADRLRHQVDLYALAGAVLPWHRCCVGYPGTSTV